MRLISETTVDGISERHFRLDDVPGVLWSPAGAATGREKTLHANPGRHVEVPAFEMAASASFFTRHLCEPVVEA
jgi:hypothetical protein